MVVLLVLCVLVALVSPAAAAAGTAQLVEKGDPYSSSRIDDLVYRADAHERNRVRATFTAHGIRLSDGAGVHAGPGCDRVSRTVASCDTELGIDTVRLSLRDGDDRALVGRQVHTYTAVFDGGPGRDVLTGRSRFRDVFVGGPGDDRMSSAAFAQVFDEGSRANGRDTMISRRRGVGGNHWVDYGARVRPVRADLDGRRDDGEQGEGDLIGARIDSIRGGSAADRLTGNGADNGLVGNGGADVAAGRGGDDALIATEITFPSREPGDGVPASATPDALTGGPGEDLLEGGAGPNGLDGGPGSDWVLGLAGADRIRAEDGQTDRLECGADDDRVWNDVVDFRADCERATFSPPGAVPVSVHRFFDEDRYPPNPHAYWVAEVTVACSVAVPCTGTVEVMRNGDVIGSAPFAIDASGLYQRVWVQISPEVAALVKRRDPSLDVAVATAPTGVRREIPLPALGADHVPMVPSVPLYAVRL